MAEDTLAFIRRCARDDGGYAPSPDPDYPGNSDTGSSDLAAVTYAATLAKTMGWRLPHPERSIEFIQRHQQADGSFINLEGKMDPKSDLAVLYNTVQGVVALRALGQRPKLIRPRSWIDSLPATPSEASLVHHEFLPAVLCRSGQAVSRALRRGPARLCRSAARRRMATWAITWPPRSTWRTTFV